MNGLRVSKKIFQLMLEKLLASSTKVNFEVEEDGDYVIITFSGY
jgi:hypothetical protein